MREILVTGGLGYVGSHACVVLAEAGYAPIIVDNLCNSKAAVLERIRELVPGAPVEFHRADLRDAAALEAALAQHEFHAAMHFAGLKAVAESVEKPDLYFENNVGGTENLVAVLRRRGVRRLIFSSSAVVYGKPKYLPFAEDHPLTPENPYGETKQRIEELLIQEAASDARFRYAVLRYFNSIGAHPSGRMGEDPSGVPNNLMPYITQVAVGRLPKLRVFGTDYDTPDGTGVRDYLHVMDLAAGHLAALRYLEERDRSIIANLGAGRGHSVRELVAAFEAVSGVKIPVELAPRRAGDIAASWADATVAERELGWQTRLTVDDMCRDAWGWQSKNPNGYPD